MNERLKAFLWIPPAGALAGVLFAAPQVVHFLDTGRAEATVRQVAEGSLPTRNVGITALAMADRGLKETVTREKSQTQPQVSFFMPLADPGDVDGPTRVVVRTRFNEVFDAVERPGTPLRFDAVVRDVLWEGLSGEVKEDLAALHPLAPDVKLLEVRGVDTATDRLMAVGAPLFGLILGLFIAANHKPRASA